MYSLPLNYLICFLIKLFLLVSISQYSSLLDFLISHQHALIKSHLVNIDNRSNKIFPSFIFLHSEFFPVINNFSDRFSFNLFNKQKDNNLKVHIQQLNNIVIELSNISSNALVIIDTSVKNNITISILYMYIHNSFIIKIFHYTVYVTSTKAKLFIIKCSINQAMNYNNISKIIVVTDLIYVAKKKFDLSSYLYQVHTVIILNELYNYFLHHQSNYIKFWKCFSCCNWTFHKIVNKEIKVFNSILLFPCKIL